MIYKLTGFYRDHYEIKNLLCDTRYKESMNVYRNTLGLKNIELYILSSMTSSWQNLSRVLVECYQSVSIVLAEC